MRPAVLVGLVAAAVAVVVAGAALVWARSGLPDVGRAGPSYRGAGEAPTSDKPQSKLWFNDGIWWGDLFDTASRTWHVLRLDRATGSWTDTGTVIDDRPTTHADVLWDGSHLYVASHVTATSSTTAVTGAPARLYRFAYVAAEHRYTLDTGFPVPINDTSSESLTLDKDSHGVLWATWTQGQQVHVNATTGDDATWGTPFVPAVEGAATLTDDDISALVAEAGSGRVGLMWSNESTSAFGYAEHRDGDPPAAWTARPVPGGEAHLADDHLNLKSDGHGHVFAAVKTSLDLSGRSDAAQVLLLRYDVAAARWTRTTFGTVADCHTRPVVVLDPGRKLVHVFATAPVEEGCVHAGTPGAIYEKTASTDDPTFAPGRGTPVVRDAESATVNDVTSTKQPVDGTSGLVVLAGNDITKRYRFADLGTGE